MYRKKIYQIIKPLSHFIWLLLLIIIVSYVTYFYNNNKKEQSKNFRETFDNIYLQKTFSKITSELKPRYIFLNYKAKQKDT